MPRIVNTHQLNEVIFQVDILDPAIAKKGKAGQFVIILLHEKGERVPLTLADLDPDKGIVTLVYQIQGKTSVELSRLKVGDEIAHVVGPLGIPTEVENFGTVVFLAGGCGVAPVYAQAKALKIAGNKIVSILGFRTKDLIFWREKMESVSDEVIIVTDDGSAGEKGFTTSELQKMIESGRKIDRVISIGPLIMMANTVKVTKSHNIKTIVSLNTLMVDGTGMCGSCRVSTSKGVKFACVDGPDMDGFDIDFNEVLSRNRKYIAEERLSLERYKRQIEKAAAGGPFSVEKCE